MSNKLLSKEKVTNALREGFDWSDQLLNEVVETVFNDDNTVPNPFLIMLDKDHERVTRKKRTTHIRS